MTGPICRGKSRTLLPEVAQKRAQMVRCCLILLRSPVDSGTATRPERRLLCQVVTPLDSERRECMLEFYRRSGARSSRAKKQLQNLVDFPGLSLWVDCTRTSCIPVKIYKHPEQHARRENPGAICRVTWPPKFTSAPFGLVCTVATVVFQPEWTRWAVPKYMPVPFNQDSPTRGPGCSSIITMHDRWGGEQRLDETRSAAGQELVRFQVYRP